MASATSILINVGAKTAPAVDNLGKVNKALLKQDDAVRNSNTKLKSFARAGAAAFAAVSAAAVIGLGFAINKLIEFGQEAVNDELNARKLDETLKNLGFSDAQLERNRQWIASMELATLVSDDQLRVALGRLTAQTGDLALAQEQSVLAADLATGANISYEKALKALQSANDGTYDSLEKYVKIQDKNKDGTIDLTEAMDGLKKAYGGAAEAAANTNPWKRIEVLWGNLREALGQYLLPLMDRLAEWFKNPQNREKINSFIERMGDLSYEVGVKVVDAIERFYEWMQSPQGQRAIKQFTDTLEDLNDNLKKLWGWLSDNRGAFKFFAAVVVAQLRIINGSLWIVDKMIGALKTLWEWIQRVGGASLLKSLVGFGGFGVQAFGVNPSATTTTVVNLYGGATEADARLIKRALERDDIAQGRYPGAPLRVAW